VQIIQSSHMFIICMLVGLVCVGISLDLAKFILGCGAMWPGNVLAFLRDLLRAAVKVVSLFEVLVYIYQTRLHGAS
jgi:hypothetical protein